MRTYLHPRRSALQQQRSRCHEQDQRHDRAAGDRECDDIESRKGGSDEKFTGVDHRLYRVGIVATNGIARLRMGRRVHE